MRRPGGMILKHCKYKKAKSSLDGFANPDIKFLKIRLWSVYESFDSKHFAFFSAKQKIKQLKKYADLLQEWIIHVDVK